MAWDDNEFMKLQKQSSLGNKSPTIKQQTPSFNASISGATPGFVSPKISETPSWGDLKTIDGKTVRQLQGVTPFAHTGGTSYYYDGSNWYEMLNGVQNPTLNSIGTTAPKFSSTINGWDNLMKSWKGLDDVNGGDTPSNPQKPTVQPGTPWDMTAPPVTPLPTWDQNATNEENMKSISDWLSSSVAPNAGYMSNLWNQSIQESYQMQKNALANMAKDMTNVSNLNQKYGTALPKAREEMMSGLLGASNLYKGYLDQALGTLKDTASSRMDDIDNFNIPTGQATALDTMQKNAQQSIHEAIDRNMGASGRSWLENMGAKGMMDSSITAQGISDMQSQANRSLASAYNDLENSYLSQKLEIPYKNMQYAMGAASQVANLQNSGGLNHANMESDRAKSALSSATDVYGNLLNGLLRQAGLNSTYANMANQLPNWGAQGYSGYMNTLLEMLRLKQQKDIADRNADIADDANDTDPWSILF